MGVGSRGTVCTPAGATRAGARRLGSIDARRYEGHDPPPLSLPLRIPRAARRRETLTEAALVVLGYLAVAVYATWPLARRPLGGFYGFGNDNWGGIWVYDKLNEAYFGGGSTTRSPDLQAPFGYPIPDQVLQPMDRLYSAVFGGLGDGLGAYNAQIFLSFILAGCTMYVLARYLTGSRLAAAVAGLIYTYSPFHLAMAMQYNSLAAIEWIPLYVLALIVLLRRGRARDAALVGAAFALVAITSYYYAWFIIWASLIVALVFVWRLARRRRRETGLGRAEIARFLRLAAARVGVAVAVALAIVVPLVLPSLQASQDESVAAQTTHPVSEAARYSARPWMLVLPPHDHPLVDEEMDHTIMTHLYDSPVYEQAIYLGYGALLLAAIGLWRRRSARLPRLTERATFARGLLVAGAAGGLLIMVGPYIPLETGYWSEWSTVDQTQHVPSLGALMFDLAPNFRFFVRAFVIVSVCLAALAAIGFARLEAAVGPRRDRRIALAAVAVLLIGFEYTNAPPHVFASAHSPAWVEAVRALPGDEPIVDYPLAPVSSPRSLYYIFWQTRHGRPTLNPSDTDEARALAAAVASPDSSSSGQALNAAGIRYAVVHTDLPPQTSPPYQPGLPDDSMPSDAGARNPWFERVRRTEDAVVYRVLQRPRPGGGAVARATTGFGAPEPEAGTTAQWLGGSEGTIALLGADGSRRLRLQVEISSFGRPRAVQLALDGRRLPPLRVQPFYDTVEIELGRVPAGDHALELSTSPGADPIGNGDPRSVSVRVRNLRVEAADP